MIPTADDDPADLRGLLFSIAYRMTGSATEAEDLVQETFYRLQRAQHSGTAIESPKAYLATTITRLAIDHLRSARARREAYVGTWLPEPIVTSLHENPERMAELSDSLRMAFLVLLESLSPVERAVFLLREAFDYPYQEIAQIVEKSEANCRQIHRRARQHIGAQRPRYQATPEQSDTLLHSFLTAARDGDLEQLVDLLATDAIFYGDGGGKATAITRPLHGRERVAAFLLALFKQQPHLGVTVTAVLVNGEPGIVVRDPEGKVVSVIAVEIRHGAIQTLRGIVNPDKLQHLGPVSDIARKRRRRQDTEP